MPAFNACSNCSTQLQPFYVKNADATQLLEVDGCRRCQGLWFDADELDKVLGHSPQLKWRESPTVRRCARCRKPMRSWLTPNGQALEKCDGCRGIFLDATELSTLGAPEAEAKLKEALAGRVEFQCLACQKHFPIRQGNAMGHGLVCGGCVPQPGQDPLPGVLPELDYDDGDARRLTGHSRAETGLGGFALVAGLLDFFV